MFAFKQPYACPGHPVSSAPRVNSAFNFVPRVFSLASRKGENPGNEAVQVFDIYLEVIWLRFDEITSLAGMHQ